jgi:uncharacterized protein (DUF305 family)
MMIHRHAASSRVLFFLLILSAASAQQIVRPGAPGQSIQVLSPAEVAITARPPAPADVEFMQGMIHHHAQAVEMAALLSKRGRDRDLQQFGRRISISQTDEIRYMQMWLEDRGMPVPMDHSHMTNMAGMKGPMMDMASMPPMPGMLTPQQMLALSKAAGRQFDHLFLTGMIQHHNGALDMVRDLFNTAGAGQDNILYDFATDIDNTQRAEIEIMQRMLTEKK